MVSLPYLEDIRTGNRSVIVDIARITVTVAVAARVFGADRANYHCGKRADFVATSLWFMIKRHRSHPLSFLFCCKDQASRSSQLVPTAYRNQPTRYEKT